MTECRHCRDGASYGAAARGSTRRYALGSNTHYELVQLADGGFIASRWGLFKSLDTIAAAEAFLRRVESQG